MKITKTDLAQLSSRLTAQQTPKATKFTATADTSMIDAYIIKLAYHAAYYTLRAMARDEKSGNADTFRRGADAFTFYLSTPNAYTDADAVQANAAAYAERDANAPKHTNASTRVLSAAESKAAAKLTAERAALAEIESRAAKLTAEIDRAAFDAANAIERATITAPRRFVKYGIIRNRSALIIDARGTIEKRRRAAERVETLTAERAAFSRERTKLTAAARKRVDRAAAALTKATAAEIERIKNAERAELDRMTAAEYEAATAPNAYRGRVHVDGLSAESIGYDTAQTAVGVAIAAYYEAIRGNCSAALRTGNAAYPATRWIWSTAERGGVEIADFKIERKYRKYETHERVRNVNTFAELASADVYRSVAAAIRAEFSGMRTRHGGIIIDSYERVHTVGADEYGESAVTEIASRADEIAAIIDGDGVKSYLAYVMNAAALTKAQREILKMLPYYPVSMIALERGTTERAVYTNIKKARAAIIAADVSTYDRYIDDANAAETERLMRIAYKKTR